MANTYDVGDRVNITGTFTQLGVIMDPAVVRAKYWLEGGVTTTLVYGVDGGLTKTSTGVYTFAIPISAPGRWYYKMDDSPSDLVVGNVATNGWFVAQD